MIHHENYSKSLLLLIPSVFIKHRPFILQWNATSLINLKGLWQITDPHAHCLFFALNSWIYDWNWKKYFKRNKTWPVSSRVQTSESLHQLVQPSISHCAGSEATPTSLKFAVPATFPLQGEWTVQRWGLYPVGQSRDALLPPLFWWK